MTALLIAISGAVFLWIAWRDLRWAVFIVTALLPTYLIRIRLGPFPSTILEVLVVITVVAWFGKRRSFPMPHERLRLWRVPILLLLIAGVMGVIMAPDYLKALGLFRAYLIEPILFFLVGLSTIRERRDLRRLLAALGVSALVVAGYAVIQRITGVDIPHPWDVERRVTSIYPFPNAVGLFLGPLIPFFFALGLKALGQKTEGERNSALPWLFLTALCVLAIIFSKTEAAWIGVTVGLALVGITHRPSRLPTIVVGLIVAGLVFGIPAARHTAIEKLTLRDWSGQVRRIVWSESLAMLRQHPIFGAGLSGYPTAVAPYHKATFIEIFQYPHNIILNIWSELGISGIIAFAWIFFVFFRLTFSNLKNQTSNLTLGLAAGMIALLIHGLADVPYFKNDLAIEFWILMMIATVLTTPSLQEHHGSVES